MTRRDIKNVAASVHARLLNEAKASRRPFNELLQYYAMERFLYRLSQSPHTERFVLKGALLLRTHYVHLARPTRDIDLLGHGSSRIERLIQIVQECLHLDVPDDGMYFDPESVQGKEISQQAAYQGARIQFAGRLGNARTPMQLDVGFGDAIEPGPIWVEYPELLDFGAPRLLGYTLESAIAEKFQALVHLGLTNSRMKDFYDLWLLAQHFRFEGERLAQAIQTTFEGRNTALPAHPPEALTGAFTENPDKQQRWRVFLRKARLQTKGASLKTVMEQIDAFLMPPTVALVEGNLFTMIWPPGGPWQ
ncbi:MAG: nucleotidyl transferase AbiEii/AbiGii toxin family protein [Rhodothermales bacterium]